MARRRGFGEIERRVNPKSEVTHRARYAMPDGTRFSRTFATKLDAEGWLATERSLIDSTATSGPRRRGARCACPEHSTVARANASYWAGKLGRNVARDADTTKRLIAAGWAVLRFWEHEGPDEVAASVLAAVRASGGSG